MLNAIITTLCMFFGFLVGLVTGRSMLRPNEYENRSVLKIYAKYSENKKSDLKHQFEFTAQARSKNSILIDSIVMADYPDAKHEYEIFKSRLFHNGDIAKCLLLPKDFDITSELRILKIFAKINHDGQWRECMAVMRTYLPEAIDIEFFVTHHNGDK